MSKLETNTCCKDNSNLWSVRLVSKSNSVSNNLQRIKEIMVNLGSMSIEQADIVLQIFERNKYNNDIGPSFENGWTIYSCENNDRCISMVEAINNEIGERIAESGKVLHFAKK